MKENMKVLFILFAMTTGAICQSLCMMNNEELEKMALAENSEAQVLFAERSFHGANGLPIDYKKCFDFCKLAENKEPAAKYLLSVLYEHGYYVKKDMNISNRYFKNLMPILKAKAVEGQACAQSNLGFIYHDLTDMTEAAKWFLRAAEQGHAVAQYNAGVCFSEGKGVRQDYSTAMSWFKKAAIQGDMKSQFNLGNKYANGQGVEKNLSEALKWYTLAARQGDVRSQFNLGYYYQMGGPGISQNQLNAIKWYKQAALQGEKRAQTFLGFTFLNGMGVKKDIDEAKKWFQLAAEQGEEFAVKELQRLNEKELKGR